MYESLNNDSLLRIRNIENGFRRMYASYDIRNYPYDSRFGIHALEITRNGQPINLFLFSPSNDGKISSISIYGVGLQGHYNAIKRSMTAFGMKVKSISLESGMSDYVDVIIEN